MLFFAALFFAEPMPLDMPRAEAYLVRDSDGSSRLEDRFSDLDLWTSRTILGRWFDESGRLFTVARLSELAPGKDVSFMTRAKYVSQVVSIGKKDESVRLDSIRLLSPFDLPEEPIKPRNPIRGFDSVLYYHGTNTSSVVAAFLPDESPVWYLALWDLAEGDVFEDCLEIFEDEFLSKWGEIKKKTLVSELGLKSVKRNQKKKLTKNDERELLRADARHSITNYPSWRAVDSKEFTIIENLPREGSFISELTNSLAAARARYQALMPSPLDGTNVLALARIFKNRAEYLDSLGVNGVDGMEWSAAYWSVARREIVAHLPLGGEKELLKTFKHEAFHQYFSYACSMIAASPWINEGYAQYFEDEDSFDWKCDVDIEAFSAMLPSLIVMDYEQFYSGSDIERHIKYRLAWSIAYFLEKGAHKVLREPFKNVKKDYIASLLKNHDMQKASADAFGSEENFKRFVAEWRKFWRATSGD